MKISWKIIIFVLIFHSIFGEKLLETENQDFLTIPKVLHDIAAKMLPNLNTALNIFIFKSNLSILEDIATDFMAITNETFVYRLEFFKNINEGYDALLQSPTFLFMDDIFMFVYIEQVYEVIHLHHHDASTN